MHVEHRLTEVRPVSGRGRRGLIVHCSCGWTSHPISAAGMADNVHERHRADPNDDYH